MKFDFNNLMQGLSGNMSEQNAEELQNEYSDYLLDEEVIGNGFFCLDDSETTITYLENIYLKPRDEKLTNQTFEFPKNTEITKLYKNLFQLAYTNRQSINKNI